MPELPEVETTLRGIQPHIQHQCVKAIIIRQSKLRWPITHDLKQQLQGREITHIERRGKYLLFKTDSGTLILHLGMSGSLRILLQPSPANKHDHVDITFANNLILRYTDPRRFGAILWTATDPSLHPLITKLGIEPLEDKFSGLYLFQQAQKRTTPIKSLIMENKTVVGIGNIYATEALFLAKINPATPAKTLSEEQMARLAATIKAVLHQAIQSGGTTLKDFVNSDGKPGYFFLELKAYGRAGKPCTECNLPLQTMRLNQRATVFCTSCQP